MSEFDLAVIGLGYVGMALAVEAVAAGLRVTGLDRDGSVVSGLDAGRSHVDDLSDADIAKMLASEFRPTTDESVLANSKTIVICVPTPLGSAGEPDLSAVTAATESIARQLRRGAVVVLESTTYPGTTDEIVRPILESSGLLAGQDFHLAYSPERVDPGNKTHGLRNTPKVVGGHTPGCAAVAGQFYGRIVDKVVTVNGTREAEMTKLLENTYRYVNIAFVNEMLQLCRSLDIDFWAVAESAATKPFGFQPFLPGPGVGGHCIPIDPMYLSHRTQAFGRPSRFIELSQAINDGMPAYVVRRATEVLAEHGQQLTGSAITLLGVAYKEDIGDTRESPANPIAKALVAAGADVQFHDPYVPMWTLAGASIPVLTNLDDAIRDADLVVVLQKHTQYTNSALRAARRVLDTRGFLSAANVVRM